MVVINKLEKIYTSRKSFSFRKSIKNNLQAHMKNQGRINNSSRVSFFFFSIYVSYYIDIVIIYYALIFMESNDNT